LNAIRSADPADLVHGPLLRWAREHPDWPAIIQDAHGSHARQLDFGQLLTAVEERGAARTSRPLGSNVLLTSTADPLALLIDFLAVIRTGRCAAVADPDWPTEVHARMEAALRDMGDQSPAPSPPPTPETPFYIGFTSGSTGLPKGFRRHHHSWAETFRITLETFGPVAGGRVLAPGRMSHSLFLFGALLGLWSGGGTSLQSRFSAGRTLATLADGSCPVMVSVPSQLLMLLTAARRRRIGPIPQLKLLLISGARWAHENTAPLQALFPQARIITFYGASETSYVSWMQATPDAPPQAVGRPFGNVQVHIGPADTLPQASSSGSSMLSSATTTPPSSPPVSHTSPPASSTISSAPSDVASPLTSGDHADPTTRPQPGLIWIRSPMLFIDYVNGQDATAARRVGEWLTVRDIGWQDAQGNLYLVGRENRMIVTQARNLFPEEVEARLMAHPDISQAAVLGLPDPQRGQVVHAVLMRPSDDGSHAPSMTGGADVEAPALVPLTAAPSDLVAWCHQALESYKVPRHWWRWQGEWPMTASGKTDLAALRQALEGAARIRP
jgi:AMP-dependent synthetase/ligase